MGVIHYGYKLRSNFEKLDRKLRFFKMANKPCEKKPPLWPLFMNRIHLDQGFRTTQRRRFIFNHQVVRSSLVLISSTSDEWKAESAICRREVTINRSSAESLLWEISNDSPKNIHDSRIHHVSHTEAEMFFQSKKDSI